MTLPTTTYGTQCASGTAHALRKQYRNLYSAKKKAGVVLAIFIISTIYYYYRGTSSKQHEISNPFQDLYRNNTQTQCQETLYQPFLVGCPDSCTGYRVDDDLNDTEYYRLTLEWYLGQAKLDLHPPLPEFGKFYDMGYNYQCPIEFVDAFGRASDTLEESLRRHHDANHINITAQKRMHMSLAYLCCLRLEEAYHVREIMESFVHDTKSFHIPDVTFERIECWKERFNSITHIIVVDNQSQQRLLNLLKQLEDRILEAGIPVPISRLTQMPFHSTLLGVFMGETYSLDPQHNIDPILPVSFAALREINRNLWTGFTFDVAHRPKYSWRPMLQAAIEQ